MVASEGQFPKATGDVAYASEFDALNYNKIQQATVKTTKIACSSSTGYVYWLAGTISLGAIDYTLSASNSGADWRNSYIIATLAGSTATISSVAVGSRTSMAADTVVALGFVDSNGVVTHYFSNTKQDLIHISSAVVTAQTSPGTTAISTATFPIGALGANDTLIVEAIGQLQTQSNSGTSVTVKVTVGSVDFTLWSAGISTTAYHIISAVLKTSTQEMIDRTSSSSYVPTAWTLSNQTTSLNFVAAGSISLSIVGAGAGISTNQVAGFAVYQLKG